MNQQMAMTVFFLGLAVLGFGGYLFYEGYSYRSYYGGGFYGTAGQDDMTIGGIVGVVGIVLVIVGMKKSGGEK